ncbi:hypothetical protein G4Z16_17950 [Streptomyces bathyalis]|uniref:Excreted virulence factor EspC (Type VII ESX diderm) n=1 Tax=Streptomyces bathyalis TaxID=2710756 RepID=A0A7T1WUJ6_9ACTN|nr:hypothetical protein [Streptomyces bathyalis]QPP07975.1 hypothetical protein G4Z16_17950 [Streptomyces bathyalis]
MTDVRVEPGELRSASGKIKKAVDKGDDAKLDEIANGADFGHGDAAKAFSELMATWNVAVTKTLKDDAESAADKLNDNAASYERSERQSQNHFTGPAAGVPGPIY